MNAECLFSVEGLTLRYGAGPFCRRALHIPALSLRRGQSLAFVGPNGSGKTSLLKVLNGLIAPSEGRALFLGDETRSSPSLRARSVYLHQHPWLFAGTVSYNVAFGCRGLSRSEVGARVGESLALVGLAGFERRSYRALSGGEAQRVALARAFARGADVLLLDEPTASADAESTGRIGSARAEAARRGATIIFSTHEEDFARACATRLLRLEEGLIVSDRESGS